MPDPDPDNDYANTTSCLLHIKKLELNDLIDVNIGNGKRVPRACITTMAGGGDTGKYCPSNGEFQWVLDGSTGQCNTAFGVSSTTNGMTWDSNYCPRGGPDHGYTRMGGNPVACSRVAYKADKNACCLRMDPNNSIINGVTCDPKLKYTSSECAGTLDNLCKSGSVNPFDDKRCQAYMGSKGSATYSTVAGTYCKIGDNIFKPECKTWITTNPNDQAASQLIKDKCNGTNLNREPCNSYIKKYSLDNSSFDDVMINYCSQHPEDPDCRCLKPGNNKTSICVDPYCSSLIPNGTMERSPFKSFAMNKAKCTYVDCKQLVNVIGGISSINNSQVAINLKQSCGNMADASDASTDSTDSINSGANETVSKNDDATFGQNKTSNQPNSNISNNTSNNNTSANDSSTNSDMMMYLFIFIIFITLIGGAYFIFFRKKKNRSLNYPSMNYQPVDNQPVDNQSIYPPMIIPPMYGPPMYGPPMNSQPMIIQPMYS